MLESPSAWQTFSTVIFTRKQSLLGDFDAIWGIMSWNPFYLVRIGKLSYWDFPAAVHHIPLPNSFVGGYRLLRKLERAAWVRYGWRNRISPSGERRHHGRGALIRNRSVSHPGIIWTIKKHQKQPTSPGSYYGGQ